VPLLYPYSTTHYLAAAGLGLQGQLAGEAAGRVGGVLVAGEEGLHGVALLRAADADTLGVGSDVVEGGLVALALGVVCDSLVLVAALRVARLLFPGSTVKQRGRL
jgi:hypothetical protein